MDFFPLLGHDNSQQMFQIISEEHSSEIYGINANIAQYSHWEK